MMGEILDKVTALDGWGVQNLFDPEGDGGCPCFSGKLTDNKKTVNAYGRCWRVSDSMESGFQDLYIWGDHPQLKTIGKAIKKQLDAQKWHNPYKLIFENPELPAQPILNKQIKELE